MKRVNKSSSPPQSLQDYAQNNHSATWQQMRNDNAGNGSRTVGDCRAQAVRDQYGLCAYCERRISAENSRHCRIEHFHPKSDVSETHNWSLDWGNMLAVCDGGSGSSEAERQVYPLPKNLSCDAHKDYMIQTGNLSKACEGYLLNPLDVPDFPNLFAFDKGTGYLRPDGAACDGMNIPGNACGTTYELVSRTIEALNLNCERLAEQRRALVVNIDKNKKTLRDKGIHQIQMPEKLVRRYFREKWPEFFTTIRCCLGQAAEEYLDSIHYQG
ncbi:MAG: TIGR02646 family protein [Desulfovibrio sp.]|nr:TIGR02646 family protein [Desulfovibrio sp.]